MPIGPNLSWKDNWTQFAVKRLMISFVITIFLMIAMQLVIYENADVFHLLLISLAVWIFVASIVDLLPRNLSEFRIEFTGLKRKNLPITGSRITHMAFGI